MNILVTSAGRRVKIVQYFVKYNTGIVVAADCDKTAPALYYADEFEIIPKIDSDKYLNKILNICSESNIDAVISLIDPELEVLVNNKDKFDERNIKLILSPKRMIDIAFDKQATHDYLNQIGLPVVPTFSEIDNVYNFIKDKEEQYPLIIKPNKGSASEGIEIISSYVELTEIFKKKQDYIIQPFYKNKEYGIDVYIDMLNGHLVDVFIKEKLNMRSGETDKSVSIHHDKIMDLVQKFVHNTDFRGPIDIDCFEYNNEFYISEINPRFGGGYPHAFESGVNFVEYIYNNVNHNINNRYETYKYQENITMMKYDDVLII